MAAQLSAVRRERAHAFQGIAVRQASRKDASAKGFQEQLHAAREARRESFLRARRPLSQVEVGAARAAPVTSQPAMAASPCVAASRCLSDAEEARGMLAECNAFRCKEGFEALAWNSRLATIAEQAAQGMALRKVPFSHDGADARFAEYPLSSGDTYGENLARSEGIRPLAAAVVRGWEHSPGHRCNLLGPFTSCGVGAATDSCGVTFVVQLLARVPGDLPLQEAAAVWGGSGDEPGADKEKAPPTAAALRGGVHSALLGLLSLLVLLLWKGGWLSAWL